MAKREQMISLMRKKIKLSVPKYDRRGHSATVTEITVDLVHTFSIFEKDERIKF